MKNSRRLMESEIDYKVFNFAEESTKTWQSLKKEDRAILITYVTHLKNGTKIERLKNLIEVVNSIYEKNPGFDISCVPG